MNRGIRCLVLLALLQHCCGYSFFRDRIPNGYKVEHPCKTNTVWNGVGHLVEQGGGNRNAFGLDFHANGKVWNKTLCMKDSDGDGQTNGQELGDPDCAWTMASGAMPSRTTQITHPGFKTPAASHPFSTSDPTTLDCAATNPDCPAKREASVKTIDLTMKKGTMVPSKTTTYYCTSFEVPHDLPYHAIAFDAILDNLNVIHHMLLYGCDSSTPEPTGECDMSSSTCRDLLAVWSLGLPDQCLPDEAGVRFGNATYTHFQLQVHWNNPSHVSTYTDESGMRIHYTPRLRLYDMGILWLGQYNIFVPGGVQNTTITGDCHPSCTKELTRRPINVTASLSHMHLIGSQTRIRHTPAATNVTKDILFQEVYDYDSPRWTLHNPPVNVSPGDGLQLVCTYNSLKRAANTTYGEATGDEMCFGFLQYYPKSGDLHCEQSGRHNLCFRQSTVCGPRCSLSIFFDNVTALVDQGIRECPSASTTSVCTPACAETVRTLSWMYIDTCLQTRHPTAYQAFLGQLAVVGSYLAPLYPVCNSQHPALFTEDLQNRTFTEAAEISKSCPSDEGITRFLPGTGIFPTGVSTQPTVGTNTSHANAATPLAFAYYLLAAISLLFLY